MKDILAVVFFAELANANEWIEMYLFALTHEKPLRKYLELPHGIPSHDTTQRVFAMVSPEYPREFRGRWNEAMPSGTGNTIRKIFALDGKTRRGSGGAGQKANHIVSAVDGDGFCVGETPADDKSNEITAIPHLLKPLNIRVLCMRMRRFISAARNRAPAARTTKWRTRPAARWKYGNIGRRPMRHGCPPRKPGRGLRLLS